MHLGQEQRALRALCRIVGPVPAGSGLCRQPWRPIARRLAYQCGGGKGRRSQPDNRLRLVQHRTGLSQGAEIHSYAGFSVPIMLNIFKIDFLNRGKARFACAC
jgi:hypothetical protein